MDRSVGFDGQGMLVNLILDAERRATLGYHALTFGLARISSPTELFAQRTIFAFGRYADHLK